MIYDQNYMAGSIVTIVKYKKLLFVLAFTELTISR